MPDTQAFLQESQELPTKPLTAPSCASVQTSAVKTNSGTARSALKIHVTSTAAVWLTQQATASRERHQLLNVFAKNVISGTVQIAQVRVTMMSAEHIPTESVQI